MSLAHEASLPCLSNEYHNRSLLILMLSLCYLPHMRALKQSSLSSKEKHQIIKPYYERFLTYVSTKLNLLYLVHSYHSLSLPEQRLSLCYLPRMRTLEQFSPPSKENPQNDRYRLSVITGIHHDAP